MAGWWTFERDEELLRLRAQKYSASGIAEILGDGLTRNAVLGRLHRLGIKAGKPVTKRAPTEKLRLKPPKDVVKPAIRVIKAVQFDHRVRGDVDVRLPRKPKSRIVCTEADISLASTPLGLSMMDLGQEHCRWPVNEPEPKGEYLFCGHPKKYGSYCTHHAAMSVGQGTFAEAIAHKVGWAA